MIEEQVDKKCDEHTPNSVHLHLLGHRVLFFVWCIYTINKKETLNAIITVRSRSGGNHM